MDQRKFGPSGVEPTTSGLDLPVLYRLSYEASTGAGRGNLVQIRAKIERFSFECRKVIGFFDYYAT